MVNSSHARNWRTMATISALVALLATGGMVWLSSRPHVVPFVVLVDSLGHRKRRTKCRL
jgi:type IV secretory pathway TrbF-like protein